MPSWRDLNGADPENSVGPAPGVRIEDGPFGAGRLRLERVSRPRGRADLRYHAPAPVLQPGAGSPMLGGFEETMELFRPIAQRFLHALPSIGRLAFGIENLEQAPNLDDANAILGDRIDPARFDLANVQDFVYQINRRRYSEAVPGLVLNRLARWSVEVRQLLQIDPRTGQSQAVEAPEIYATLTSDVNTDAEFRQELQPDQREAVFVELERHSVQLAADGDRI